MLIDIILRFDPGKRVEYAPKLSAEEAAVGSINAFQFVERVS